MLWGGMWGGGGKGMGMGRGKGGWDGGQGREVKGLGSGMQEWRVGGMETQIQNGGPGGGEMLLWGGWGGIWGRGREGEGNGEGKGGMGWGSMEGGERFGVWGWR